ncbi:hypothetical protein NRF20_06005 [Streptomyces sp. R-74717]|uniref:hypothetical protein n=1 Tax=Streptomyces TaxID=1883 RepID=UPI0037BBA70A
MPGGCVRALRVLAPAPVKAGPATAAADPDPQQAAPAAPVERRTSPDGYRRAIEAHRQAAPPSRIDPDITQAVERQTAAMRELSRRAFPEPPTVPHPGQGSGSPGETPGPPTPLARVGGPPRTFLAGWCGGSYSEDRIQVKFPQ